MGRYEDRHFTGLLQQTSMNSSRDNGSRPLNGSSKTRSLGRKGRAQANAIFIRMPWGEIFNLTLRRQVKLAEELGLQHLVPSG